MSRKDDLNARAVRVPSAGGSAGRLKSRTRLSPKAILCAALGACSFCAALLVALYLTRDEDGWRLDEPAVARPLEAAAPAEAVVKARGEPGAPRVTSSRGPAAQRKASPEGAEGKQAQEADPQQAASPPQEPASLLLQVVDPDGAPLSGLVVSLVRGAKATQELTSEDGAVLFERVAPGLYDLRIQADAVPLLTSARSVAFGPAEAKELTVTCGRFDLTLSGRVLDRDGNPVAGIKVSARKHFLQPREGDFVAAATQRAESAPDGKYTIEGLELADYEILSEATEKYPAARGVFRAGVGNADLVLGTGQLLAISGRVVSAATGAPLENATVVVVGQAGRPARTDAQGQYSLELKVDEGRPTYFLRARSEGHRDAESRLSTDEGLEPPGAEVDFVLDPLGALAAVEGVLVDARGRPLGGESVALRSVVLRAAYGAATDEQGQFRIEGVQVGSDYRLLVYPRQGFKDYSRTPVAVSERGLQLKIVLEPLGAGNLSGIMVDPAGKPVPEFKLRVRSLEALQNFVEITGDGGGRFVVEEVPAGKLVFETEGSPRLRVDGFVLEPGKEEEVTLVLDWGDHSVSGTVVDERRNPVAGIEVNMAWSNRDKGLYCSSARSTKTDAAGRFSFSRVAEGLHRITAAAPEIGSALRNHTVGQDKQDLVLELVPQAAR